MLIPAASECAEADGSTLRTLHVSRNGVGDAGGEAIALALRTNRTLTTIGLGYNAMGNDGVAAVHAALRESNNTVLVNMPQLQRQEEADAPSDL